jgi:hypothetical protein
MRSDLIITRILAVLVSISYLCCGYYSIHMQRNYKSTSKESAFIPYGLSDSPLSAEVSLFTTMETKQIEGYPDYFVTSSGDVYSKRRNFRNPEHTIKLKPGLTSKGYLTVQLYKEGGGHVFTIHRLVGKAFIPNPLNLPQINHKDTDKTNNHVWNLEWCDNSYNHLHAFKHGQVPVKGEQVGLSKLTEKQVKEIRQKYIKGIRGCYNLAKEYGVFPTTISNIVNYITWKHI